MSAAHAFEHPEHPDRPDRFATARAVADAVLYEGYVLYPYRASSSKNQVRWQFGVLAPRAFSESDGSERWSMRSECIVDPGGAPQLAVRIRFLQMQHRAVSVTTDNGGSFAETNKLEVDGAVYVPWDEAIEQVVELAAGPLLPLESASRETRFEFAADEQSEMVRSRDGVLVGRIFRRREAVDGRVQVKAEWADGPGALLKVIVTVENATDWSLSDARRDQAIARSLVAVHTILAVDDAMFVSLLEPSADASAAVAGCVNDGTFPVLIGSDDVVLSSPIILYDHPEVAPESPGDLYDSTEIDEILALRVLTLTDEEKAEARATDPRAAAIIDRCDNMPPEMWERLHGVVRELKPFAVADPEPLPWWEPAVDESYDPFTDTLVIGGRAVSKGTPVRLRPSHRSDSHDMFLDGLNATVTGVFTDVDEEVLLAVTVDDDPVTEALAWQGRALFFHPDEVEVLA